MSFAASFLKHAANTSKFLALSVWQAQFQGAGFYACLHEACKLSSILLLFEDIERFFSILNVHSKSRDSTTVPTLLLKMFSDSFIQTGLS